MDGPSTLGSRNRPRQVRIDCEKSHLPASSTDSGFVALAFGINAANKGVSAKSRIGQGWWLGDKIDYHAMSPLEACFMVMAAA
jgi:hypothetical protein